MYKIINLAILLFLLASIPSTYAQVAINEDDSNPAPSAILDVKSIDKGLLMPRMTTMQRDGISNPADGLVVYDTDTQSFHFFNSGDWSELLSGSSTSHSGRSIFISSSSIQNVSLEGGATHGNISFHQTIDMSNASGSTSIKINLPMPADYVSGFTTAKILYTSSTTTGDFRIACNKAEYAIGTSLTPTPGNEFNLLPSPNLVNRLMSVTIPFGDGVSPTSDVKYMNFSLIRTANDALDTSSGTFRLLGIVLEYEAE